MKSADTIKKAEDLVEHLRGCSAEDLRSLHSQFWTTGLNTLATALARTRDLELAVEKAAEWGWCRESREILWGALTQDSARIQKALDQSAGLVAEALQVVLLFQALGDVRAAAMALVTAELQRRKGLRGPIRLADWKPLVDALASALAEEVETDLPAFEAEVEQAGEEFREALARAREARKSWPDHLAALRRREFPA